MTLTDLANHICTQCGMNDTDDVAAAQMFLQRRLEMIWNSALWRDSLLEATLTLNPNDTTTLADSYWISERSVLLLPSAIEKVIAARLNTNALEAASLESYYRTDTDWLDYQGSPYEFQVLKPVVMEWATAQNVNVADSNAADTGANPPISCNFSYSPDGVTINNGARAVNAAIGSALQLFSFSKPATQGNVLLQLTTPVSVAGDTYTGTPQPSATVNVTAGQIYTITPGANENGVLLVNGTQTLTLATGVAVTVTAQGATLVFQYPASLIPANAQYGAGGSYAVASAVETYTVIWGANETAVGVPDQGEVNSTGAGTASVINCPAPLGFTFVGTANQPVTAMLFVGTFAALGSPLTAAINLLTTFATVTASSNGAAMHQRIRLTEAPQVAINLRVLGKGKCPILGPYDTAPITNAEPALMAFARGDLLLRQRQFGKAALAQQEGAALLKELMENEAFQQAGEFRIQPDGGFGSDNFWMQTTPDSYRPLG
jgi:hypothetical protein